MAVNNTSSECLGMLVQAGADVNLSNLFGDTTLALAVRLGLKRRVKMLLKAGADVSVNPRDRLEAAMHNTKCSRQKKMLTKFLQGNARNCERVKPLLFQAVHHGQVESLRLLLKAGADVNTRSSQGETALKLAWRLRKRECADVLMRAGADVNTQYECGWTPLMQEAKNLCDPSRLRKCLTPEVHVNVADATGSTALSYAAQTGSVESLQVLLDAGADVNTSDCWGKTPLIHAVQRPDNEESIKLLLSAGADVNVADKGGMTALQHAVKGNQCELVGILITAGADVNCNNPSGMTPLMLMSQAGNADFVKLLINAGADVNTAICRTKKTALMLAAEGEHKHCQELLLKAGADVNAGDKEGTTVLQLEVQRLVSTGANTPKDFKLLRRLVKAGADVNKGDRDGLTPLMLIQDNECLLEHLVAAGADVNIQSKLGFDALWLASRDKHHAIVEKLIALGADVNATNHREDRPLIRAVINNDHVLLDTLTAAGADVNKPGRKGRTPLLIAVQNGKSKKVVRRLLKAGADANVANELGQTPLLMMVLNGTLDYLKQLVKAGADVNLAGSWDGTTSHQVVTDDGLKICSTGSTSTTAQWTPLQVAIKLHMHEAVEKLVAAGADVNKPRDDGTTPLMTALMEHCDEALRKLIQSGADLNKTGKSQQTPLLLALRIHYYGAVQRILQAGADVNIADKSGETPVSTAIKYRVPVTPFLEAGADLSRTPDVFSNMWLYDDLENAKALLRHGVHIGAVWSEPPGGTSSSLVQLAFVAGVRMSSSKQRALEKILDSTGDALSLGWICRRSIRGHMMRVSRVNLFVRVPKLGITGVMERYLLFEQSVAKSEE